MNQLMNYEAVYRRAPATPGMLYTNNPVDREYPDNCEIMIASTGKHIERMVRQHLFRKLTN